jgi:hypothetical protein
MSSSGPATLAGSECPEPPLDFSQRELPTCELNVAAGTLFRIHRSVFGPLFYNRRSTSSTVFRFDASNDEFGVLYAAPSFSACMIETVIRDRFEHGTMPLIIDQHELEARSISSLEPSSVRTLRLADFTQPLFGLGGDGRILSTGDYRVPNLWSSAVYAHPKNVDGIYFRSRFAAQPCVALFDRIEIVARGTPLPLMDAPELEAFLDKYSIGLV